MLKRFFEKPWRLLSRMLRLIGAVQISIILALFYYVILGPFAIGYRLVRAFSSKRKTSQTFWIRREQVPITKDHLLRQY